MAKSQPKISLSVSRDIPFNKLVLSQANVRRTKARISLAAATPPRSAASQ